jgi:hypothetical protein
MSRMDRLKELSNPLHGPQGAGRDQKNLDYWADCATANSKLAPRATGIDETVMPHSTGKSMDMRSTTTAPREARSADARMVDREDNPGDRRKAAKADTNTYDAPYLRGVRRQA